VEAGNEATRTDAFSPKFQKIVEELKPQAAYFTARENGERGDLFSSIWKTQRTFRPSGSTALTLRSPTSYLCF